MSDGTYVLAFVCCSCASVNAYFRDGEWGSVCMYKSVGVRMGGCGCVWAWYLACVYYIIKILLMFYLTPFRLMYSLIMFEIHHSISNWYNIA